jgi:hypothetical protein
MGVSLVGVLYEGQLTQATLFGNGHSSFVTCSMPCDDMTTAHHAVTPIISAQWLRHCRWRCEARDAQQRTKSLEG